MTGNENPKKKKRRLIRIIGSLLSLAVLTYIAIMLISGRGLSLSWLTGLFPDREPAEMADEFHFEVGRDRVFAYLGDSLAAAGTLGVQVLDIGGGETLRDPFRMSKPAISALNGRAIAFDIGGSAVRVFDKSRTVSTIETHGAIVSASINRNGWFCVCTLGSGGYKGVATVYNDKGNVVYNVSLSSGYILSAELSPDNGSLAVLNLTGNGSRITFYHGLSSESADNAYDFPGGLIVDIWYPPDGDLVAVTTESLITVSKNGVGGELYAFHGRRLGAYAFEDDFFALHLLDYGVGYRGQLVTLAPDGKLLGVLATDRELVSVSSCGGYLAILRNDGPGLFSAELEECPISAERVPTTGASLILSLGDGAALAAGDHSAAVIRADASEELPEDDAQ